MSLPDPRREEQPVPPLPFVPHLAPPAPVPPESPPVPRWAWARRWARAYPWLLFFAPALYLVTVHLSAGRVPLTHSYLPNVLWSHEWSEAVRQGVWYPRWMEHTFAGLGSPTFHFYAPLAMATVLPFSLGLGLPPSLGVLYSSWAALLVLGLGVTRLVQTVCSPSKRLIPVLAGVLAMLSPYALCDVYVRGALAETWSMALLPWLLAALFRSLESPRRGPRFLLVMWTAAFALCHPATLLMGTTALGLALGLTLIRRAEVGALLKRAVLPVAGGLLLDAFYLASAVGDQRHVNIGVLTAAADTQAFNRLLVTDLARLSPKLAGGFDGQIVPGFVTCLVIAALVAMPRLWRNQDSAGRQSISVLLVASACAGLMMTDLSRGVYALVPLLNKVQFSWRWMAVLTVTSLALWGHLAFAVTERQQPGRARWRIPFFLLTGWVATQSFSSVVPTTRWDNAYAEKMDALLARSSAANHESDAGATPLKDCEDLVCLNAKDELLYRDVSEYLPLSQPNHEHPPRTFAPVEWAEGDGAITDVQWRVGERRFVVDAPQAGRLLVRTTAWLGWQVSVNGRTSVGDQAGDFGRMTVEVPAGRSNVVITYRGTPFQRLGNVISLATILALAGLGLWTWRRRARAH